MFPTFKMLFFVMFSSTLVACASHNQKNETVSKTPTLTGTWQVEDIDQGGVIDNAMVTIEFLEDGRISGSTGCNRFSGSLKTEEATFVVSKTITTRRACVPAIAKQEQRFLSALNEAAYFKVEADTWLVIFDASHQPRLKLIETTLSTQLHKDPIDKAASQANTFQCEQIGEVNFRFLGPETIKVSIDDQQTILTRQQSASGAKYTAENMTFWNKGNKAQLSLNGLAYPCVKSLPRKPR